MPLDSALAWSLAKGLGDEGREDGEPADTDSDASNSQGDPGKVVEPGDLTQSRDAEGDGIAQEAAVPLDSSLAQSLAKEYVGIKHGAGILEGNGGGAKEHKLFRDAQEGRIEVSRMGKTLLILPQPRPARTFCKTGFT